MKILIFSLIISIITVIPLSANKFQSSLTFLYDSNYNNILFENSYLAGKLDVSYQQTIINAIYAGINVSAFKTDSLEGDDYFKPGINVYTYNREAGYYVNFSSDIKKGIAGIDTNDYSHVLTEFLYKYQKMKLFTFIEQTHYNNSKLNSLRTFSGNIKWILKNKNRVTFIPEITAYINSYYESGEYIYPTVKIKGVSAGLKIGVPLAKNKGLSLYGNMQFEASNVNNNEILSLFNIQDLHETISDPYSSSSIRNLYAKNILSFYTMYSMRHDRKRFFRIKLGVEMIGYKDLLALDENEQAEFLFFTKNERKDTIMYIQFLYDLPKYFTKKTQLVCGFKKGFSNDDYYDFDKIYSQIVIKF